MLVEAVQMMSTGLWLAGESAPWKPAFQNHPMTKWVRASADNFAWTHALASALARENVYRFDKSHGGAVPLPRLAQHDWMGLFGAHGRTEMPLCMPDDYKVPGDPIASYRAYYRAEKARFSRYTRRPIPFFMRDVALPMTAEEIEAATAYEETEPDAGPDVLSGEAAPAGSPRGETFP